MPRTLPGGMTSAHAVRLILSRRPRALLPGWLARWDGGGPVLVGLAVGLVVWLLDRLVLRLGLTPFLIVPFALLIAAAVFFIGSADTSSPQLHPLRPHDQPGLYAMVAAVAEQLGVRRPARIWLWAMPNSIVQRPVPWRTELWLGLPYATEMTVDELRAVVAHGLTLAQRRRSWLVDALYQLWSDGIAQIRPGGQTSSSDTEAPEVFLVEIGAVVQALLQEADQAGVRVAGRELMASALLRGATITGLFPWFAARYVWPLVERRSFAPDLYAGWRWKLRSDGLLDRSWRRFRPFVLEDPRPACSMSDRISALGGQAENLETPPQPARQVLLSGAPEAVEERFSRWYVTQALPRGHRPEAAWAWALRFHAIRFRDVAPEVWDGLMDRQLQQVTAATARLLGQSTATAQDVVAVVRAGRAGELSWDHRAWICSHPSPGVCALFPVIHRALRAAGYEYDHPLRQRELVGRDGDRLDVTQLAERIEHGERPPQVLELLEG